MENFLYPGVNHPIDPSLFPSISPLKMVTCPNTAMMCTLFLNSSLLTFHIIIMHIYSGVGYGDKDVYNQLNPELESRLPREDTEWRR